VAEIPLDCVAPAVANAAYATTGAQIRQIRLLPERVWRALQGQAWRQELLERALSRVIQWILAVEYSVEMRCGMFAVEFQTTVKDGVIEIPPEYRKQIPGHVRVILLADEMPKTTTNMIDLLLAHPVEVQGFRPSTREEAHA